MSIPSGNGGFIQLAAGTPNIQHVSMWTGNWANRLAEVSNSGFAGSQYAPTLPDPSWSISLPRDDAAFPEALGLVAGAFLANVYFKLGADSKFDRVQATTVEAVQKECNSAGDVVRITITGKGGIATYNVAGP